MSDTGATPRPEFEAPIELMAVDRVDGPLLFVGDADGVGLSLIHI